MLGRRTSRTILGTMASGSDSDDLPLRRLGDGVDSVDEALVRSRLLAGMFERGVAGPAFGRFELREQIGAGGMGRVYRAWDPQLEREVAVKLINAARLGAGTRQRALREAKALAKISHPNVIAVFDAGLVDARVWIAMEYAAGTTLRVWQEQRATPERKAVLRHWIDVGRGLAAVHGAGLVHRDVKPSNVLIAEDGRARLIDFGLVHDPGRAEGIEASEASGSEAADATVGFVGTYAYAAPEQIEGGAVTAAADQYSLCTGIWESLCGARPAPPKERGASDLVPPPGVRLPNKLRRILGRGLAAKPEDRYAEIGTLLDELESAVAGPSRRAGLALGASALGAVVAGFAFSSISEDPVDPCVGNPSALDGTWDEERRAQLRARVSDSDLPFASATAKTTEAELDAWARGWHGARRGACVATRIEGTQSDAGLELREACLEGQRRSLAVALDTLLVGEPNAFVARAPAFVDALPELEACIDPRRLAEVEPLPQGGERREAILAGFDTLARARAMATGGEREQARAALDDLLQLDRHLGYAPLSLEARAFSAQIDLLRGRVDAGLRPLVDVAREAEARHLDELAARLWSEAAEAAAGRWSKPELERWLVAEARTAVERLEREREPLAPGLMIAEGQLATGAGELEEALADFEAARALAAELGKDEAAEDTSYVAATLGRLGRLDEAQQALDDGRAAALERWGPGAPKVAQYDYDLGVLALQTGAFEDAAAHFDRAEATYRAALGPDSFPAARVAYARVKLLMFAGKLDEGLDVLDRVEPIYVRELGREDVELANLYEARGVLRYFEGDITGSLEPYATALTIIEATVGPASSPAARLHSDIGESQLALGKLDAAIERFGRALAIQAHHLPEDHPSLALPLKGRGQARLAAGQAELAVGDLERALDLQLTAGAEPLEIADLRFSLARALAQARDDHESKQRTRALAMQARVEFEGRSLDDRVEAVDTWLR